MPIIRISHEGERQRPLLGVQKLILTACCCAVDVEQYAQCAIHGEGFIEAETEYTVEIVLDGDEIHAYIRRPSHSNFPILEIIFFRDAKCTLETI